MSEYKIPVGIKQLITLEFLEIMLRDLKKTDINVIDFEWDEAGIVQIGGTGLWFDSIKLACEKTSNTLILDYYKTLNWIDGDKFDDIICDLMVEHKLIAKM